MKPLGRIGKTHASVDLNTKEVILTIYNSAVKTPEEKVLMEMRLTKYDARHLHDALHIALPYVE